MSLEDRNRTIAGLIVGLAAGILLLLLIGCDSNQVEPTTTQFQVLPEDFTLAKTSAEKDAYCRENPGDTRCSRWCNNPRSNCDDVPPPPEDENPVASFTYAASGLSVQFSNTSTNYTNSYWEFGDGSTTDLSSPSHTYSEAGSYTVTLTVLNRIGADNYTTRVTVSEDTPPPPSDGSIWMAGHSYMRGIETMADLGAELGEYRGGEGFLSTWVERADVAVEPARDYEHAGFIEWLQRQDQVAGSAQAAAQIESIVGYDIAVMVQWFQTEPSCTTHGLTCGPAGQDHFNDLYEQMAAQSGVDLIPVGDAFVNAYNAGVTNLHTDGSHASAQGEYLRNVTIYSYFSGIDARTMPSLGVASASVLKQAAYDALNGSTPPPPTDGSPLDVAGVWPMNQAPNLQPGDQVVFTGYSNSSQHASTFIGTYQGSGGIEFINCAVGGNALENWVSKNLAAGCAGNNVKLTLNQVSTQGANSVDAMYSTVASEVPKLHAQLKARYPNAVHAYYPGEPAHWVSPSKCPRICEPLRYETGLALISVLESIRDTDLTAIYGPYSWSGIGEPQSYGVEWFCTDFNTESPGCSAGVANQHPNNAGRAKMAGIYARWMGIN